MADTPVTLESAGATLKEHLAGQYSDDAVRWFKHTFRRDGYAKLRELVVRAENVIRAGQQGQVVSGPRSGMITARAGPLRLSRCHPRFRRTATVADDRSREGRRDPGPAPPTHCSAAPTRRSTPTATTGGPGIPRRTSRAAVSRDAAPVASAGQPGHRPAVAPRPDEAPPHAREPAPRGRATPYHRRSVGWSCAWLPRTRRGVTAAFTVNSPFSASPSPRQRCGRSSRQPHRAVPAARDRGLDCLPALPG